MNSSQYEKVVVEQQYCPEPVTVLVNVTVTGLAIRHTAQASAVSKQISIWRTMLCHSRSALFAIVDVRCIAA